MALADAEEADVEVEEADAAEADFEERDLDAWVSRHEDFRSRLPSPLVIDAITAVMLFLAVLAIDNRMGAKHSGDIAHALRWAGIAGVSGAVALRRPMPRGALLLATASALLTLVAGGAPQLTVGLALTAYTTANIGDLQPWWRPPVVMSLVVTGGVATGQTPGWLSSLFPSIATACFGWFAGQAAKERRTRLAAMQERREEQERQRAAELRQAATDERFVIARELHDIVAHSMSVIAVRAGVARMVMDSDPGEVREALTIIETSTRKALTEMRLLVSVLREEDAELALAPAPGLGDLDALTQQVNLAGVTVKLDIQGQPRPLLPGIDLSAYRIAQEALTNVVRHAGPTTATLRIEYLPGELAIEVTDEGPMPGRGSALTSTRPGHGLIGMAERTALYSGTLHTGRHGSGFQIRALLRTELAL